MRSVPSIRSQIPFGKVSAAICVNGGLAPASRWKKPGAAPPLISALRKPLWRIARSGPALDFTRNTAAGGRHFTGCRTDLELSNVIGSCAELRIRLHRAPRVCAAEAVEVIRIE